ncbi:MAG: hypothetical protein IJA47_01165 [Oscillospiraceae bacterium]|nr:hypothetical protein [Oscillospiraceae bacterium]
MKKLLALLLVVFMLVSMVACGYQGQNVTPTQTEKTEGSTYTSQSTEPTRSEGSLRDGTQKSKPAYFKFFEFMIK